MPPLNVPAETGSRTRLRPHGAAPLLLGFVVLVCFCPILGNEFVNWDDDANFLENPAYRGLSPSHLHWMFTTFHMGNYQPLTWLTLGLDYEVWGMNPGGYHFTSLVLHVASTILFYLFLSTLLGRVRPEPSAGRWPALLGALFFAIHPLRVESVAWATERKDVLCGFFVMLTLLAYLRMDRERLLGRPGTAWLVLSVVMFSCSLLSKALGLMIPFVLFALDVYPLGRFVQGNRRRVLLEKIPFIVAAGVQTLLTFLAIREAGLARALSSTSVLARAEEGAYGLSFYLWKTAFPLNLSPLYPAPRVFDPRAPLLWGSVLSVLVVTMLCLRFRRRYPAILAAWFCYAILLLPVLRLTYDAPHIVADRYSYLSCLPLAVLVAFFLDRRVRRLPAGGAAPLLRQPGFLVAGGILGVLGLLTFLQTRVWRDSITLWDHALRVNPSNTFAYNNRGTARAARSDRYGALADFDRALKLDPDMAEALYNRGSLKTDEGDLEGAIRDETEAIRISPDYGRAWYARGRARKAKGDEAGARADFEESKRILTAYSRETGQTDGAGAQKREHESEEVQALNNEGNLRASKGDFGIAIDRYTRAIQIDPSVAALYNNRGNARASLEDHTGAVSDYTDALRLDPSFAEAHANRGMSRALLGDLAGAVDDYSEALKLDPRDPAVRANRGVARAKLGDRLGAVEDFERALALAPADWPRRPIVENLLHRVRGR